MLIRHSHDWVAFAGPLLTHSQLFNSYRILSPHEAIKSYVNPVSYTHLDVYKRQDLNKSEIYDGTLPIRERVI